MESSIFRTLFVITIAFLLFAQAQSSDCICGGLGQGTNPCSCSEVVVKAAQLPKPTFYVPAQEIKDAATVKSSVVADDCSRSQSTSNTIVQIDSNPSAYSNGGCGCSRNLNIKPESSAVVYTDTISSEPSEPETVVYTAEVSYDDNSNQPKSDCGCSKQNIETLDTTVTDTTINGNIVPQFSPVGDLCYPLPVEPRTGKIIEKTTRVTPAYPGKLVCCPPSVPYEICINTATGETRSSIITTGTSEVIRTPDTVIVETQDSPAPSQPVYETITTTIGNNGMSAGVVPESLTLSIPKPLSVAKTTSYTFTGPNSATYNLPLVYANIANAQRKMAISRSSEDCFDDVAVNTQVDSYPTLPADAVSLTLAYKNLRAPNVIYRQGKQFVPEDKLAFGHRTVPADTKNEKLIVDIPEEKLVTVNKPVVELKIASPKTVVIGSYDEQEEAKLAELEAFERESIMQEETAEQMAESLITYKDLGYAPVGTSYGKSMKYINRELDDSAEEPCGPLGPPVPGYIPGSVIVQQQQIIGDITQKSGITDLSLGPDCPH